MKRGRKFDARAGGLARAKALTPRRRSAIARKAAKARWHGQAEALATTCKAEETEDGRVSCAVCGLSWDMRDASAPVCPHIAGLKAMPPMAILEGRARDICHALLHGGHRADFDDMLPHRPDWQAHVEMIVRELMTTCAEVH